MESGGIAFQSFLPNSSSILVFSEIRVVALMSRVSRTGALGFEGPLQNTYVPVLKYSFPGQLGGPVQGRGT